jgi:histidine triad (HIT) family protein
MTDCIFCKIVSKEIPADIIYETDEVLAFLDNRPISRGHALVVPKQHFSDMLNTDDRALSVLACSVKKVAQAIMDASGAAGFNLGVNTGKAAGQIVFHTHFHIIPRYSGDGLVSWPHTESEPSTRTQTAEEIKKFIK